MNRDERSSALPVNNNAFYKFWKVSQKIPRCRFRFSK